MEGEAAVKKLTGKRYISEEVHERAKIESPVVNELLTAARKGNVQQVLAGLNQGGGARPSAIVDRHGRNCLQLACLYGHYETALAILQSNKIKINSTNKRGLTALHDASTEGHTRVALLLLSMGADVLARTKDGWTCLMCACSNGHVQLARILIAAGCEANEVTAIGLSALHIAAWKGQAQAVDMLIHAGCTVLAESKNGKTALQLAQEEGQVDCIMLLQAATSESPEYRITALESQIKSARDKLGAVQSEYRQALAEEREQSKQKMAKLTKEKEDELLKAKEKLKRLDDKVTELQLLLKHSMNSPPPHLTLDPATPPPHTATKRSKKKEKESPVVTVLKESRERSASYNDLTTVAAEEANKKQKDDGRKLSIGDQSPGQASMEKRSSLEKRSITELVADSLLNPSSMAAIRQELKSDNFTPKIQRKMKNQTNQTTLPSLSNGPSPSSGTQSNRSPLAKESRGSPLGGSPVMGRPRWTNPSLKDSVI